MKWIVVVLALVMSAPVVAADQWWRWGRPKSVVPTSPLSSLPLIYAANVTHLGGFRMPQSTSNNSTFASGGPIAYNPANNSLYAIGYTNDFPNTGINGTPGDSDDVAENMVAEITIPSGLSTSATPTDLPLSSYLQQFIDPAVNYTGTNTCTGGQAGGVAGMVVQSSKLYMSCSGYYDASYLVKKSVGWHSLDLTTSPTFSGYSPVYRNDPVSTSGPPNNDGITMQGWLNVGLAGIPTAWQTLLGGTLAGTGWGLSIVSRESYGPSLFSWDASAITGGAFASGFWLLGYPNAHQTLGLYENVTTTNLTYNQSGTTGGMVIVANTRSMLQFGRIGTGIPCYGGGTSDISLHLTPMPGGGQHYCYDPGDNGEGTHAYPYVYRAWGYDLLDLVAVKAGTKQPYDVVPYTTWTFTLPPPVTVNADTRIGGVAYDEANQKIYITQLKANLTYGGHPLVQAFQVTVP